MPAQQLPADPGLFAQIAQWGMSAIAGALVVLVAFRTRIALMGRENTDRKREIIDLDQRIATRLDAIDRRQMLVLELVADIARKVGVDARFSDAVVRFLAEEARGGADRSRASDDDSERRPDLR